MTARLLAAIVAVVALGGGCTPTPLGADDDAGAKVEPPSTHATQKDGCPPSIPLKGDACFASGPAICQYWESQRGCAKTCVCGFDNAWRCLEASCGLMTPDACVPGAPCDPKSACSTSVAQCACNAVGRLECQLAPPQIH